jgi:hypothetical protein
MSLQYCYPSTPNIEAESFRLLALYDLDISSTEWNVMSLEISNAMAAVTGAVNGLEASLNEVQKMIVKIQCEFCRRGL